MNSMVYYAEESNATHITRRVSGNVNIPHRVSLFSLPGKRVYLEGMRKQIFFMDLMSCITFCTTFIVNVIILNSSTFNCYVLT
jgi:hypothetical protein